MANISLKDIQFPGLNNVYKVPEVDNTLTQSGEAADAKKTGDEITALKQDLEGLDVYTLGLYPQMSVADTAVASFTDGADDIPVKSLTVDITPVQSGSGDPSPSNVRPISGWTGAKVNVFAVNAWDEEWEYTTRNGMTAVWTKNYVPVMPNTQYRIILQSSEYSIKINQYDKDKTLIDSSDHSLSNHAYNLTTMSNCAYIMVGFNSNYGTTYKHDVSINYPSSETAYHAYKGDVYSVDWTTEAGTVYGGTLDVTNGVLTVTNGYVDLGTLSISYEPGANPSLNFFACYPNPLIKNGTTNLICTKYPRGNVSYASGDDHAIMAAGNANQVRIRDTSYTDAATFKTAMSGVYLVYELAMPVTYQLTPTEVTTLLRNNNIFADTGNVAELTYRADLKAYIDEKLA